jgi:uncharacterized membrane protein YgdD (TMEM256/DUF423 family)
MNSKTTKFVQATLLAGACCLLLGIILGAFGAHALRDSLAGSAFNAFTFQTGVHYQIYHGLGLMILGLSGAVMPDNRLLNRRILRWSAICMLGGIILFSGSLYLLALTGLKFFGPVTPIGGILLITGWLLFAIAIVKGRRHLKSI